MGLDNIITMTDEQRKLIYDSARSPPEGIVLATLPAGAAVSDKRWRLGGIQFEALMRMLDNAVCSKSIQFSHYLPSELYKFDKKYFYYWHIIQ